MIEDQSYEDEDWHLMQEIIDVADLNKLFYKEMAEAFEAALLLEPAEVPERLKDLCDFFHEKIHRQGLAANRLQRLVGDIRHVRGIMQEVEKVDALIQMLVSRAEIVCDEHLDTDVQRTIALHAARAILQESGNRFPLSYILDMTSDDLATFRVKFQRKDSHMFFYTVELATTVDSPVKVHLFMKGEREL